VQLVFQGILRLVHACIVRCRDRASALQVGACSALMHHALTFHSQDLVERYLRENDTRQA